MRQAMILVPLDGREHSLVVLPVVKKMAELLDATVHVLHVGQEPLSPQETIAKFGISPDKIEGMVIEIKQGDPAQDILQEARDHQSNLIVMCTHTAVERPHGHLGKVAEAVLCQSDIPVLFVQPERGMQPWELRRILFPHDGAPATTSAIAPTLEFSSRIGAELDILHAVVPEGRRPEEPGSFTMPAYVDQPQHEWPNWAYEYLERIRAMSHVPERIGMHLFLKKEPPGEATVHFAQEHDIDLITLAWHGQLSPHQANTLKYVMRNAPCPVLILRIPAGAPNNPSPLQRLFGEGP